MCKDRLVEGLCSCGVRRFARSFAQIALSLALCAPWASAQSAPSSTTGELVVDNLLRQMTLDEKIALLHGGSEDAFTSQGQAGYLAGVPRLGIPPLRLADGPPGVLTRIPAPAPTATMGLAATFSEDDAYLNGKLVALEARQRAIDVVLQPFINMDRDFQFGRGYNTYGEDPMLTGAIGANFIRGVQDQGIMAQAKHFIGYDTDGETVRIDPQTLHEFYLAPFADAIEAGVSSLMCSYNRINGPYACGNPETLQTVLRGQLDFQGFVTSDWGATHAADFLHHGLDMEMPGPLPVSWAGPSYFVLNPWRTPSTPDVDKEVALNAEGLPEETHSTETQPASGGAQPNGLKALVASGAITEAEVTRAARRVLFEMNRFGRLDSGVRQIDRTDYSAQIAKIIEKTSVDAAVLLKNENHALPLDPASVKSVALIGPGARQVIAVGYTGEKAVGRPEEMIGPYEALRSLRWQSARCSPRCSQ